MGTKDFEDEKHLMSSRSTTVNAETELEAKAFSKAEPGQVFLSLCVNFLTSSHTAITQLRTFVLKRRPLERRKALYKCYRNNSELGQPDKSKPRAKVRK